jgi:hypothetical protein
MALHLEDVRQALERPAISPVPHGGAKATYSSHELKRPSISARPHELERGRRVCKPIGSRRDRKTSGAPALSPKL